MVGSRKIKCSDLASKRIPVDCEPHTIHLGPESCPQGNCPPIPLGKVGDPIKDSDGDVVGHIIAVDPVAYTETTQMEIVEDPIYSMPVVARASKRARIVRVYEQRNGYRFNGKTFTQWVRKPVRNPAVYRTTVRNRDPRLIFENVTLYVEVSRR